MGFFTTTGSITAVVVAILAFLQQRALQAPLPEGAKIITSHPILDAILEEHKAVIGKQYHGYRNHCLTVMNLANHRMGGSLTEEQDDVLAVAAAFHDIALWTDNRIDYLDPSIARMEEYAKRTGRDKHIKLMRDMIYYHHKIFTGAFASMDPLIGAFQAADSSAFTFGLVPFDMSTPYRAAVGKALPNKGFHNFLVGRGARHLFSGKVTTMGPAPMFVL
eukprot:CAMPEP_0114135948 /NCGR_PEP_ID=MMETSP0043_2-20121206/14954_1 /TAXON_ID=464988 /ORGANISM="Hemiselmis andersenii, Strain CCMP644" /LENGTH=218 /DNA_ID=CAMNT_0001229671 /DNA_START=51 /DNA_END=707 /DNA_ORIENTATION=+